MIKVIDIASKTEAPTPEGHVTNRPRPIGETARGSRSPSGRSIRARRITLARSEKTQVAYVLEGKDATLTHTSAGKTAEHKTQRRAGVYLEPGEEAT